MDLDDIRPVKKPEITIGEDLSLLSVAELEDRIQALESEIARIREALASKQFPQLKGGSGNKFERRIHLLESKLACVRGFS
jgi:uncharacterized small protein (DUF1192 family)